MWICACVFDRGEAAYMEQQKSEGGREGMTEGEGERGSSLYVCCLRFDRGMGRGSEM